MSKNIAIVGDDFVPSVSKTVVADEITFKDIVLKIYRRRRLVLIHAVLFAVLVLAFHCKKQTFFVATEVRYSIALTFLNSAGTYPNGTIFSLSDIVSTDILRDVIATQNLNITTQQLSKAVHVNYSYSSIVDDEHKFQKRLFEVSSVSDIRRVAMTEIQSIRKKAQTGLYVAIDTSSLGVSVAEGRDILTNIVSTWIAEAINSGLLNVDIKRPVRPFVLEENRRLLDAFDNAEVYLMALEDAVREMAKLPGINALIVDNYKLSDVRHEVEQLGSTDIRPLRKYAYANSHSIVNANQIDEIKLLARKRLLKLELWHVEQLISSYDLTLVKINQDVVRDAAGTNIGQANGAQIDQSFLSSMLDIGSKLSSHNLRKDIHDRRSQAMLKSLALEKEISILEGTTMANTDAAAVLMAELSDIEKSLNQIQAKITLLVDGYRSKVLKNGSRLYIPHPEMTVFGGASGLFASVAKYVFLGLILGGMVGIVFALLMPAKKNALQIHL